MCSASTNMSNCLLRICLQRRAIKVSWILSKRLLSHAFLSSVHMKSFPKENNSVLFLLQAVSKLSIPFHPWLYSHRTPAESCLTGSLWPAVSIHFLNHGYYHSERNVKSSFAQFCMSSSLPVHKGEMSFQVFEVLWGFFVVFCCCFFKNTTWVINDYFPELRHTHSRIIPQSHLNPVTVQAPYP